MKKICRKISILAVFLLLSGCQKELDIELENLVIEPEIVQYIGTEDADNIAVDEQGILYTSNFILAENSSTGTENQQEFSVYDLDGTCMKQVRLTFGNGNIRAMVIEDGMLYCIVPNKGGKEQVLMEIDLTTWEAREVTMISEADFSHINRLIVIGDYFYLFGQSPTAGGKSFTLLPGIRQVNYTSETLARLPIGEETSELEFFNIDFPLDVFRTKENSLMVYHYNEEKGFGFLEFVPEEESLYQVGEWNQTSVQKSNFCSCEEGYLFISDSVLHYGTIDGMEAQITTNESSLWSTAAYVKEYAFYYDYEEMIVERVRITDTLKENKEIRFLMHEDTNQPNGCGYRMKNQFLSGDAYALKVLAQDADFDMFLLSSRTGISYNIKQNGAFYALNDVPGVEEYLDACFPYLKELATNEDGDIWMIPVELAIPALVYPKEYVASQGIDFSNMSLEEFFDFVEQVETQTPEKGSISHLVMIETLFGQYLNLYDTFDTEIFRNYAKQLRSIYESAGRLIMDVEFSTQLRQGNLIENFYSYHYYLSALWGFVEILGDSEEVGVVGVPSMSEEIGNIGTLTFIAVNPNSQNLEATLQYIATFCQYMMTKQDSFILQDISMYTNTPFIKECYETYAKGDVYFWMDTDIYWNLFWDYVEGKMELEDMVKEIERKREIYVGE